MGAILEAIENNPKEIKRLLGIDQEQFRQWRQSLSRRATGGNSMQKT